MKTGAPVLRPHRCDRNTTVLRPFRTLHRALPVPWVLTVGPNVFLRREALVRAVPIHLCFRREPLPQGCGILPRHVRPKAGQTLPQRGIFPAQKRTPLPCRTRALRRALPSTMVSTPAASRAAPETICKMPMAFFIKIPSPAYS